MNIISVYYWYFIFKNCLLDFRILLDEKWLRIFFIHTKWAALVYKFDLIFGESHTSHFGGHCCWLSGVFAICIELDAFSIKNLHCRFIFAEAFLIKLLFKILYLLLDICSVIFDAIKIMIMKFFFKIINIISW